MRDKIITYVYRSEVIKMVLNNLKLPQIILKEDMMSHLLLELMEMDYNKLEKAYNEGYLDKLCVQIMVNNRTKTGKLFRLYNTKIDELGIKEDKDDKEINDDIMPLLVEALAAYNYQKRDKFLEINYNLEILKMYYWEKMTYKQIADKTGIKANRVRNSIIKSKDWIKIYIKNKINYE
jgi:hypothetical protein